MLVNRRSGSERARPRRCIVRRSETVAKPWQQGVCHGVLLKKSRKRTRQRNTFPKSTKARKGKRTLFEICSGRPAPTEGSVLRVPATSVVLHQAFDSAIRKEL